MSSKSGQPPSDDFELLVRQRDKEPSRLVISGRVRWYSSLLVFGFVGCVGCLWATVFTPEVISLAQTLGMRRVANSLENVLELLALPTLLFSGILCVYASRRLHWLYRSANKPEVQRRRKSGLFLKRTD